jgi:AraC-like DNA-binding protein
MYGKYYFAMGDFDKALEYIRLKNRFYEDNKLTIELDDTDEAEAYYQKGNYKTGFETLRQIMQRKDEYNTEQFYAQINELHTIYELDKAEREAEQRQATIRQLRLRNMGLTVTGVLLIVIVGLTLWNRNRIARKNRGLYQQIKEQDRLTEELERLKTLLDENGAEKKNPEVVPETVEEIQHRRIVARMNKYLLADKNFTKPDTDIDKLVEMLNISRTYLYQAVKSVTRKTVQDYIHTLRLEEAKRVLDTTDDLIETIAQMCGYNNRMTFHRQFRERYHISPEEYRRMAHTAINA